MVQTKKLDRRVVPAETERRAVEDPSQQAGAQSAEVFMNKLGPKVGQIMNHSGYDATKGLGP